MFCALGKGSHAVCSKCAIHRRFTEQTVLRGDKTVGLIKFECPICRKELQSLPPPLDSSKNAASAFDDRDTAQDYIDQHEVPDQVDILQSYIPLFKQKYVSFQKLPVPVDFYFNAVTIEIKIKQFKEEVASQQGESNVATALLIGAMKQIVAAYKSKRQIPK